MVVSLSVHESPKPIKRFTFLGVEGHKLQIVPGAVNVVEAPPGW
jgi:hypothetical protein